MGRYRFVVLYCCSVGWCCADGGRFLQLFLGVLRKSAREGSAAEVDVQLECATDPTPFVHVCVLLTPPPWCLLCAGCGGGDGSVLSLLVWFPCQESQWEGELAPRAVPLVAQQIAKWSSTNLNH